MAFVGVCAMLRHPGGWVGRNTKAPFLAWTSSRIHRFLGILFQIDLVIGAEFSPKAWQSSLFIYCFSIMGCRLSPT